MEWQTTNQRRNEILMISCALSIPPKEKARKNSRQAQNIFPWDFPSYFSLSTRA